MNKIDTRIRIIQSVDRGEIIDTSCFVFSNCSTRPRRRRRRNTLVDILSKARALVLRRRGEMADAFLLLDPLEPGGHPLELVWSRGRAARGAGGHCGCGAFRRGEGVGGGTASGSGSGSGWASDRLRRSVAMFWAWSSRGQRWRGISTPTRRRTVRRRHRRHWRRRLGAVRTILVWCSGLWSRRRKPRSVSAHHGAFGRVMAATRGGRRQDNTVTRRPREEFRREMARRAATVGWVGHGMEEEDGTRCGGFEGCVA
ncbi:hypothetical protein C8F01DRAFT_1137116 [Mycena amicta]|nr:hypothetical protein C8F01DRAFT_1137116 [Mycena amicta]